ncbi:energy transducer TonB [Kordiimonas laminariae]|uniref:energy transducer TonB n=1 Tax=Kordiimonas laminariae TaxID=2917717 RepID=UPI001FF2DA8A|nr:energy transducer TonB [Kordiimonas laminariae]MCK0069371.1 energy transducer TonB [Kordiimonas laminariae]
MPKGIVKQSLGKVAKLSAATLIAASFAIAAPVQADERSDWTKAIAKKVAKSHVYPRSAIQREIEGRAKVRITIDRAGAITNYEVVEPTGKKVLDKVIPRMVKKMSPLPTPPGSVGDNDLTFILPITWRLQ